MGIGAEEGSGRHVCDVNSQTHVEIITVCCKQQQACDYLACIGEDRLLYTNIPKQVKVVNKKNIVKNTADIKAKLTLRGLFPYLIQRA